MVIAPAAGQEGDEASAWSIAAACSPGAVLGIITFSAPTGVLWLTNVAWCCAVYPVWRGATTTRRRQCVLAAMYFPALAGAFAWLDFIV